MSDIIIVSNRKLCLEPLIERIGKLSSCHPAAIILREKDLSESLYKNLASEMMKICNEHGVKCILHSFYGVAAELNSDAIHMPLAALNSMPCEVKQKFKIIGASCHSIEEAVKAEQLGCSYIIIGHIFDTDCKKGMPGRGTDILAKVCRSVSIPVYGIGGINCKNAHKVRLTGAAGVCIMSSAMTADDPEAFLRSFEDSNDYGQCMAAGGDDNEIQQRNVDIVCSY